MIGTYIHFDTPSNSGIHIMEISGCTVASLHTDYKDKKKVAEAVQKAKSVIVSKGMNPIIHESLKVYLS